MEKMIIGKLHPIDQEKIDAEMDKLHEEDGDPYEDEPERHSLLMVHSDTPMNAEVPASILTREYITPTDLFYIRNHHPVPRLSDDEVEDFRLEVDLSLFSDRSNGTDDSKEKRQLIIKLSLDQIKSLPKVEVISTLQCSGNRRSGFNQLRQTSGTNWGQGAISTAKWGGVKLVDVLQFAAQQVSSDTQSGKKKKKSPTKSNGNNNPLLRTLHNLQSLLEQQPNLQYLRMESLDGMHASIPVIKALSPFGDVILAYEMNGEPISRDHGYPLRMIVPGYAAVRNVKWLSKIQLSEEESEGPWQRGLNYKILPPSVLDATGVDLDNMPSLTEEPVISGITSLERAVAAGGCQQKKLKPGDTVLVSASGWAWAGGGRNIVRVDVTGDDGKTWEPAAITQGTNQPFGKAWAWVFWQCDSIPAKVCNDGHIEVSCKGVDTAFNTQPPNVDGMWNVRGLANNSWYRSRLRVV
jgi:sulfite oxidase